MGSGYMGSLVNSMSLMLEEFYSQLDMVGVSSFTGEGFDEFLTSVDKKVEEYESYYKAERERILKAKEEEEKAKKQKSLEHLMKDLGLKDKEAAEAREREADVVSDIEDETENDGIVLRDEDEGIEREYTFANEDRLAGEVNGNATPDLQKRYEEAFQKVAKSASSETAENIARYIRQ